MRGRQIVLALHFEQTAGGALEFEGMVALRVQFLGRGGGGHHQLGAVFVERVTGLSYRFMAD